jgi:hypothetical protein
VASAFLQIGEKPGQSREFKQPFPKWVYNDSGGPFIFGTEYGLKRLDSIAGGANASRDLRVSIVFYLSLFVVVVVLIFHCILVGIFGKASYETPESLESRATVILNPYCRDSSAQIIVPGFQSRKVVHLNLLDS